MQFNNDWDKETNPPKAGDLVLIHGGRMAWWKVVMVVVGKNRFVCFHNEERKTFDLDEIRAKVPGWKPRTLGRREGMCV